MNNKISIKVPRKLRQAFFHYVWSFKPRSFSPSNVPVSVLIPLAAKDLEQAALALQSIRKFVSHPIENIYIVGQNDDQIRSFCHQNATIYINEEDILPESIKNLTYEIAGKSQNGWIRQQIIKLTSFAYIDAKTILVHDADTIFVRPISFMDKDERQLLFTSDEYLKSYHRMTEKLLGPTPRYPRSFIAHGMLFQRDLMAALHNTIQINCGMGLVDAVITHLALNDGAALSEYEVYGNYLYSHFRDRIYLTYWFNYQITHPIAMNFDVLTRRFARFNSVSRHIRPNHRKKPRLMRRLIAMFTR